MATFDRLVRFHPLSAPTSILIGEPADANVDVGAAIRAEENVQVRVYSGTSILRAGTPTDRTETIGKILSPVTGSEAGTVRCIGLNYVQHAQEVNMEIPKLPTVFMKPETSIADPWPAASLIPKYVVDEKTTDYESELAVVIGKEAKNVSEDEALDHVLGYTAANDISARKSQFDTSQWGFSKGFDGSCPIGPVLVSNRAIPDPSKLRIRGLKNGRLMQDCGSDDLIFSISKIVSFLSQGTTLKPGTVIITGTPAGVGHSKEPKEYLGEGDEFSVEILPHIGTLTTIFKEEK